MRLSVKSLLLLGVLTMASGCLVSGPGNPKLAANRIDVDKIEAGDVLLVTANNIRLKDGLRKAYNVVRLQKGERLRVTRIRFYKRRSPWGLLFGEEKWTHVQRVEGSLEPEEEWVFAGYRGKRSKGLAKP